jgi:hypothetical protein
MRKIKINKDDLTLNPVSLTGYKFITITKGSYKIEISCEAMDSLIPTYTSLLRLQIQPYDYEIVKL